MQNQQPDLVFTFDKNVKQKKEAAASLTRIIERVNTEKVVLPPQRVKQLHNLVRGFNTGKVSFEAFDKKLNQLLPHILGRPVKIL